MISAIIVNRNGRNWIERCLESLGASSCDDLEIIVVDNASTDGSLELVIARYPHVSIVRMAHNVGFAVANNLGAVCSRGDTLLLLNHDAWLEPGCLGLLKKRLDTDPGLGLVVPRLVRPDGRSQFVWAPDRGLLGEGIQRLRNPFEDWRLNHGIVQTLLRKLFGPGWYTAACALIRKGAFDEVGGFDPTFFLYFEDADLCIRLRGQGWRLDHERAAVAVHAGGGRQLDEATMLHYRQSQVYYYGKHRPVAELRRLLQYLERRHRDDAVAHWLRTEKVTPPEPQRILTDAIEEIRSACSHDDLSEHEARSLRILLECLQVEMQRIGVSNE